jgi:hypothetical protein
MGRMCANKQGNGTMAGEEQNEQKVTEPSKIWSRDEETGVIVIMKMKGMSEWS